MRIKALAAGLILSWATVSLAQSAPTPSPFKFEMHGFASGTLWMGDGSRSGGGGMGGYQALPAQPQADKLSFGTDVRQSRFAWAVTGPQVFGGATPKAYLEIDWDGGYTAGNFGEVHLVPRLRLAYAELNWGTNRIVFGQNTDVMILAAPFTLAWNGIPYYLPAGWQGFRRPGVFGYHTFGNVKDREGTKVEFAWEIGRSSWTDAVAAGGFPSASNNCPGLTQIGGQDVCPGEASGLPAVQAHLAVAVGTKFSMWVAGHWNRVDRNGNGVIAANDRTSPGYSLAKTELDVISGKAGFKAAVGPATLAVEGFLGKNTTPLYGGFGGAFFTAGGDVHEYGGWGQLGLSLTKEISAYQFWGISRAMDTDLLASGFPINRNITATSLLQYRDGGYAIGVEWTHTRTNYTTAGGVTFIQSGTPAAGQVLGNDPTGGLAIVNTFALTGIYYF